MLQLVTCGQGEHLDEARRLPQAPSVFFYHARTHRNPEATEQPGACASVLRTRIAPHRLYGQQEGTFAGSPFLARLTAISLTYCLQEPSLRQRVTGRARRVGQVNVANRGNREPTSGLEPLTPAHYECAVRLCRGLLRAANPAFLQGFLFCGLPIVAPYCAPDGIRVVSISPSHPPRSVAPR